MLATLMAATLLGTAAAQQTDTVFAVPANARLAVQGIRGEVTVRVWDRNQVRVQADHDRDDRIEIAIADGRVRVGASARRGAPDDVELTLTIPATMPVEIDGPYVDVELDGLRGEVRVETTHGDISLRGGRRFVRLHTMQGEITVVGAEGRVDLNSVHGEVTAEDIRGELIVGTVGGEVMLERITSEAVQVSSVNGDIEYRGTLGADGQYTFTTHNGDVTLDVPARTSATVSVSTFSGEVESDFPLTLRGTEAGGNRFTFTLGSGQARIEIASFSGTIRLRQP